MPDILLAAIHHGELPGAPARTVIDDLREDELVQQVVEITEQPPFTEAIDREALAAWRMRQVALERTWREYLGIATAGREAAARAGSLLFRTRLRLSATFAAEAWRTRQVERFVAAKHVQAWRALLAGPWDALLVVESDATMQRHSLVALQALIDAEPLADPGHAAPIARYVNVAGGLSVEDLAVEHLIIERPAGRMRFGRPVSNTSCAYLINRPMAVLLLEHLDRSPEDAQLGIDWIFNACFVECEQRGIPVHCEHADPPALGHGSITGVTESWHPRR